jgi:hypothetical protein
VYLSKVQRSSVGCSIASKLRRVRWVGRRAGNITFQSLGGPLKGSILLLETVNYNF